MPSEIEVLAARIRQLEGTVQRSRRIAIAIAAALLGILLVGAKDATRDGSFDYLEVKSLTVRNAKGDAIVLTADDKGASLFFMNLASKKVALSLDSTDSWPSISLNDRAGAARLTAEVSDGGPSIDQRDASGKTLLSVDADDDSAGFRLYEKGYFQAPSESRRSASWVMLPGQSWISFDVGNRERAKLGLTTRHAELALWSASGRNARVNIDDQPNEFTFDGFVVSDGPKGASIWSTLSSEGPQVSIKDAAGFTTDIGVTNLETADSGRKTTTSAASLVMFGKTGKAVWSAP